MLNRILLATCLILLGPLGTAQTNECPIDDNSQIAVALFELRSGDDQQQPGNACLRRRDSYVQLAKKTQDDILARQISAGWQVTGTDAARFLAGSLRSRLNQASASLEAAVRSEYEHLATSLESASTDWNGPYWYQDMWQLNPAIPDPRAPWPRLEHMLTDAGCGAERLSAPGPCSMRYRQAQDLINHIIVMHDVVDGYTADIRQRFVDEASLNHRKWRSFFDAVQFQYPWELSANYLWSRKFGKRQAEDAYGNPLGLRVPPNGQWIVLHPDVGISYYGDEPSGDQLRTTLIMQWLGYQWVSYDDDHAKNPWGLSLIGTYSDTTLVRDTGYGVMLHYGKYGLGVTDNDGDIGVTVNFDLLRFVRNDESPIAKRLKNKIPDLPGWFE